MQQKRLSFQQIVPLALLAIGLIFVVIQFLLNVTNTVAIFSLKVEHPSVYSFPEFESVLKLCVKGDKVDYRIIKDAPELSIVLKKLSMTSPDKIIGWEGQLAYWINTFNLLVIKEISDRFPISTIKQLGNAPNLGKYAVGGELLSVQDIWLSKICPLAREFCPEAIFTCCNGTISDPILLKYAVSPDSLVSTSTAAASSFINNQRNVEFDRKQKVIFLSPFFQWNEFVFAKKFGSVEDCIMWYLSDEDRAFFNEPTVLKSYSKNFDWHINYCE